MSYGLDFEAAVSYSVTEIVLRNSCSSNLQRGDVRSHGKKSEQSGISLIYLFVLVFFILLWSVFL